MKHFFSGMMLALALVAALVVGVVAVAENAAPEMPSMEAVQPDPAQPEQTQPDQTQPDQSVQQPAADTELQQAYDAYRAAKQSGRQEALEDELKGYVEAGKLTQEQADLILKDYKEREALRNGTCPNCGYQFENGMGKGGRMNGGKGMKGGMNRGKGGRMNGGRGMFNQQQPNGQQPDFGQQPNVGQQPNAQANGAAILPEMQLMQDPNGFEGI
ncbi:MAG: hypothetical protein IKE76_05955 [Clostridia bacterium]|nr:hypothetical protein [Clostridia bacterium]